MAKWTDGQTDTQNTRKAIKQKIKDPDLDDGIPQGMKGIPYHCFIL